MDHLVRFNPKGSFYFRKRIPVDLVPILGQSCIHLSLKDGLHSSSRHKAAILNFTIQSLFDRIRLGEPLTAGEIRALLRKAIAGQKKEVVKDSSPPPSPRLRSLIERYLKEKTLLKARPKTVLSYRTSLGLLVGILGDYVSFSILS